MHKIIVADTSILIILDKIGNLDLLRKLFGEITITQIIADEYGKTLPDFISIENPYNKIYQKILESFLDPGEASAIAIAIEKEDCLLIIDDMKGRREANQLGLKFTGTIGLLIVAKEKGFIKSVGQMLNEIRQTDFSDKIVKEALKRSGEAN